MYLCLGFMDKNRAAPEGQPHRPVALPDPFDPWFLPQVATAGYLCLPVDPEPTGSDRNPPASAGNVVQHRRLQGGKDDRR
jgi:hypothetical protein